MLTHKEILERKLKVFILEPYRFPKEVKFPEAVDIDNNKVSMWVPRIPDPQQLAKGVPFQELELEELDENNSILKEVEGYVVILDESGTVVAESKLPGA